MKSNTKNTIRLGIFVTLGVLLLLVGIYFIGKKQQLFNSTIQVSAVFKDISGLIIGNNVRFAGINIGVIENIEVIADTAVRVDMSIDEKITKFIKQDAKAIIGSDGLIGNKILIILPGTSGQKTIKNNAFLNSITPVNIDDILLNLQTASLNISFISEDLSVITDNIRQGKGTIGKLFMDTAFAEDIDQTIGNIKQGAGGFKENMDAASKNIFLRGILRKKKARQDKPKS